MVGVPRSTGCSLCIRRRVKCDQERPGCGNCLKYGVACPGYDRGLKFVDGKHVVRTKQQARLSQRGKQAATPSASSSSSGGANAWHGYQAIPDSYELIILDEEHLEQGGPTGMYTERIDVQLALLTQPRESREAFIKAVIGHVRLAQPDVELIVFGGWFAGIPERLGRRVTLDSATCAFVLHLLGKTRKDPKLVADSRTLYGQSLVALQRALNHPTEWKSSETLCSTILLCIFELFNGTAPSSWMHHAKAVSHLMQQRGPEAHKQDWDKAMLVAFRGLTIMNSLFGGGDCFLAKRAWREVAKQDDLPSNIGPVAREYASLVDRYMDLLAQIPSVLREGYILREANKRRIPVDPADVSLLVRSASRLRSKFLDYGRALKRRAPAPIEMDAFQAAALALAAASTPQAPASPTDAAATPTPSAAPDAAAPQPQPPPPPPSQPALVDATVPSSVKAEAASRGTTAPSSALSAASSSRTASHGPVVEDADDDDGMTMAVDSPSPVPTAIVRPMTLQDDAGPGSIPWDASNSAPRPPMSPRARASLRAVATAGGDASSGGVEGQEGAAAPTVEADGADPMQDPLTPPVPPLFDTILVYNNIWDGSLYMGYWASLVILQQTLQECWYRLLPQNNFKPTANSQPGGEKTASGADDNGGGGDAAEQQQQQRPPEVAGFSADNAKMVRDILRSVAQVSRGVMGPYRVGYAIRIAYEFSSPDERRWVGTRLAEWSGMYGAVGGDIPPEADAEWDFNL